LSDLAADALRAGLTADQIDDVQAWLLWQWNARRRRAQRNASYRRAICRTCLAHRGSPHWRPLGDCARCAARKKAAVYRRRGALKIEREYGGLGGA
jgi:hypothetical protein